VYIDLITGEEMGELVAKYAFFALKQRSAHNPDRRDDSRHVAAFPRCAILKAARVVRHVWVQAVLGDGEEERAATASSATADRHGVEQDARRLSTR
jgi:hypothetical protein